MAPLKSFEQFFRHFNFPCRTVYKTTFAVFSEYEMEVVRSALSPVLTTDCHSSETTVALPVALLRRHHVTAVTLDEPTCRGVDNTTHLVLKILGRAQWVTYCDLIPG